jgi:hypothetical protein
MTVSEAAKALLRELKAAELKNFWDRNSFLGLPEEKLLVLCKG